MRSALVAVVCFSALTLMACSGTEDRGQAAPTAGRIAVATTEVAWSSPVAPSPVASAPTPAATSAPSPSAPAPSTSAPRAAAGVHIALDGTWTAADGTPAPTEPAALAAWLEQHTGDAVETSQDNSPIGPLTILASPNLRVFLRGTPEDATPMFQISSSPIDGAAGSMSPGIAATVVGPGYRLNMTFSDAMDLVPGTMWQRNTMINAADGKETCGWMGAKNRVLLCFDNTGAVAPAAPLMTAKLTTIRVAAMIAD